MWTLPKIKLTKTQPVIYNYYNVGNNEELCYVFKYITKPSFNKTN